MGKMAHQTGGSYGIKEGGRTTGNTGGSMSFSEDTPKTKSKSMGGSSDAKALGRAAAGSIETKRGKRGA